MKTIFFGRNKHTIIKLDAKPEYEQKPARATTTNGKPDIALGALTELGECQVNGRPITEVTTEITPTGAIRVLMSTDTATHEIIIRDGETAAQVA